MMVLDLANVDLRALAEALEDHSGETTWYLDLESGEVGPWAGDADWSDEEQREFESRNLRAIDPVPSQVAYGDMKDFIARVEDPRARDLLDRAIAGRGAFRRFKDALLEFPELREAWFRFHDERMARRAIDWLADEGLVDRHLADQEVAKHADPDLPAPVEAFDPLRVARGVAEDLRRLYGRRLRRVLLFGSWSRGDAHPESDVDILVVLDRVESVWAELRKMDEIAWRHSFDNDTVITFLPVAEADPSIRRSPTLIRAFEEGRDVA